MQSFSQWCVHCTVGGLLDVGPFWQRVFGYQRLCQRTICAATRVEAQTLAEDLEIARALNCSRIVLVISDGDKTPTQEEESSDCTCRFRQPPVVHGLEQPAKPDVPSQAVAKPSQAVHDCDR